MIGIIDTEICNIRSLRNTLKYLNFEFISINKKNHLVKNIKNKLTNGLCCNFEEYQIFTKKKNKFCLQIKYELFI